MKFRSGLAIVFLSSFAGETIVRPDPFLTDGTEITYTVYSKTADSEVHKYNAAYVVSSVENNGGYTRSEVKVFYDGDEYFKDREYKQVFTADSTAFYVYAGNFRSAEAGEWRRKSPEYEGDSLEYPYRMKCGDTLDGAYIFYKTVSSGGNARTAIAYGKRYVAALDTLFLPFGNVLAYRIESNVKYTINVNAFETSKKIEIMSLREWFVPSIGIVKSEQSFDGSFARTEMKSYKRK